MSSKSTPASAAVRPLASKATGYPIARVASKIAVGKRWMKSPMPSPVKQWPAFEPALDYIVVKIPRWPLINLPAATFAGHTDESHREVMAIDRTLSGFPKAVRSLEFAKKTLLWKTEMDSRHRHQTYPLEPTDYGCGR